MYISLVRQHELIKILISKQYQTIFSKHLLQLEALHEDNQYLDIYKILFMV